MLAIVVTLFSISLAAELAGFTLIVRQVIGYRETLRTWVALNPESHRGGSYGQMRNLNGVVMDLLGAPRSNIAAALLVGVGIVSGAAGNFLSLNI